MSYRVIRGIGKSRLWAVDQRTLLDYTFPLTQQGGFSETWEDEIIQQRLISVDMTSLSITEKQKAIGSWCTWELHWDNFPLITAALKYIRDFKNLRITNPNVKFFFQPKIMANDFYEVNIISGGLQVNNSDASDAIGNFGVNLIVKTIRTQPIHFTDANDIVQYQDYEHA